MTDLFPDPDGLERKPSDPELHARALAKARGEVYDPKKHGPFDYRLPPRQQRKNEPHPTDADLAALIDRFRARGKPVRDRPDVRRVAGQ